MIRNDIKKAANLYSKRYGADASKQARTCAAELGEAGFKEEAHFWLSVGEALEKKKHSRGSSNKKATKNPPKN